MHLLWHLFLVFEEKSLDLLLNPVSIEEITDQMAHPRGNRNILGRSYKGIVRGKKSRVECPPVIDKMAIHISKSQVGENSLEMRRLLSSSKILDGSKVRHSHHANIAIAPRLYRCPLDGVRYVFLLARGEMDCVVSF